MRRDLDRETLDIAMRSLAIRLDENRSDLMEIVICGGSALILTRTVLRTTRDVDVVALIKAGHLASPAPLPDALLKAVAEVAEDLGLESNWLNNGPSHDEGGLFQMGLPVGFVERLTSVKYGARLTAHFVDRLDHIYFKLYAAVDRGGYHIEDLRALDPTPEELEAAASWSMTHDVSGGFRMLLKRLLKELGYEGIAERI